MRKFLYGIASTFIIFTIVGCSSLIDNNQGVFGNAQKAVTKVDTKVRSIENAQAQSNEEKLSHIGAWAQGGVDYSLSRAPTNIPEVIVAKEMNERVEALAGKPDFNEVKEIEGIVNKLLSQITETKAAGEKELAKKDKQIEQIQNNAKQLDVQRENEIANAFAQANQNAQVADQYKATLNDMDKWGGLGAVFYGLKKFIIHMAWILGIGGVLFLILRLLASSNPIAASIFSIFSRIGSWFINTIEVIVPTAAAKAGQTATKIFNATKGALTSIVDSVETVKLQSDASGKPATIEDLLNTAEMSMSPQDKALIEKIKVELGWVKSSTTSTVVVTTTPIVAMSVSTPDPTIQPIPVSAPAPTIIPTIQPIPAPDFAPAPSMPLTSSVVVSPTVITTTIS